MGWIRRNSKGRMVWCADKMGMRKNGYKKRDEECWSIEVVFPKPSLGRHQTETVHPIEADRGGKTSFAPSDTVANGRVAQEDSMFNTRQHKSRDDGE